MTKHKEALEALGRMRPTNNVVQSYMDDWHIVKNYLQAASWQPIETLKPEPNKSYLVSNGKRRWFAPMSGNLKEQLDDLQEYLAGCWEEDEDGNQSRWKATHWMDTGLPAAPVDGGR